MRHLEQQTEERRLKKELEAKSRAEEDARQLLWAKTADRVHFEAQLRRRALAERVAIGQQEQMYMKDERDKELRSKYENHVDEAFFEQFGVSHR